MNTNTSTNTRENHTPITDANIDATLRRAAANMGMPEGLSAARLAAITGGTNGAPVGVGHEAAVVRRRWIGPRRAALMASAAAVALAAGTIAVLSLSTPRVQASTILESLRNNAIGGLSIEMNMVGDSSDEIISGTITFAFASPVSPASLFPESLDQMQNIPEPSAFTIDVNVNAGGEEGFAGRVRAARGGGTDWVYAKIDHMPSGMPAGEEGGFLATVISNVLRTGVLVDLGPDGFAKFAEQAGGSPSFGPQVPDMPDAAGVSSVEIEAHQVKIQAAFEAGRQRAEAHRAADLAARGIVLPEVQPGDDQTGGAAWSTFDSSSISGKLRPLLTGDAGASQLHALADLLKGGGSATVTDQGNGDYLLTTTAPVTPDEPPTAMAIAYRQGEGVRWVRVTLGSEATPGPRGTVTITPMASGFIDPARLDKANAVPQGAPAPMPIDGAMLMGLLGG